MEDEIKEILECLEKYGQLTPDAIDDLHYIRDYITNLQDTLKDREEYCNGLETHLTNLQCDVDSYKTKYKNAKENLKVLQEELEEEKRIEQKSLDTINELQEENERLTQGVTLLTNKLIDMTKEKENYKSRCEKAREYINRYKECKEHSELPCYETYYKDLDIILNGDDE